MRDEPRFNPLVTGAITAVVFVVVFAATIVSGIPGGPRLGALPVVNKVLSTGVQVKAELPDADALQPHASVEIAGVKVGEVHDVTGKGSTAIVTMDIDSKYADIHQDASVKLRPHGLFGPKFVQIDPGTSSAPLMTENDMIPGTKATLPVDLDQVLHELQAPERQQLQTVFVELGRASQGRGDDVNHLLAAANSLTGVLDEPVRNLDSVAPNLSNMLQKDESFNAYFAQTPLDKLVDHSNHVLEAFAQNSDHLQSILVHANGTLSALDASLTGQTGNLRATIETLPRLIDKLNQFNDLLSVFGANLTGKEPGFKDVTSGIIGAIENPRSATSGYDKCVPNVNGCPADGQAHYVRVQSFNVTPQFGTPQSPPCIQNPLPPPLNNIPGNLFCPKASATVSPGGATLAGDGGTGSDVLQGMIGT